MIYLYYIVESGVLSGEANLYLIGHITCFCF